MRRFEYRVEIFRDDEGRFDPTPAVAEFLERVNALGAEGWEIYQPGAMCGVVHLKRVTDGP